VVLVRPRLGWEQRETRRHTEAQQASPHIVRVQIRREMKGGSTTQNRDAIRLEPEVLDEVTTHGRCVDHDHLGLGACRSVPPISDGDLGRGEVLREMDVLEIPRLEYRRDLCHRATLMRKVNDVWLELLEDPVRPGQTCEPIADLSWRGQQDPARA
jgi:hypothetical protein